MFADGIKARRREIGGLLLLTVIMFAGAIKTLEAQKFEFDQCELYDSVTPFSDTNIEADGTRHTTIYSFQKYYFNGSRCKTINESFKVGGCAYGTACVTGNTYEFFAGASDSPATILKDSKNITMKIGSLGALGVGRVQPVITGNSIMYQNVTPNVDLRYFYTPEGIKEEFILKKNFIPNIKINFTFPITSSSFTTKNGELIFSQAFKLQSFFAEDAKGSRIVMNWSFSKGNISLELPIAWLRNTTRAYPVVIDPSINLDVQPAAFSGYVQKCFVCASNGTATIVYSRFPQTTGNVLVGYDGDNFGEGNDFIDRSAVRFDVSSLPNTAYIEAANVTLTWAVLGDQAGSPILKKMGGHDLTYYDMPLDCDRTANCGFFEDMRNNSLQYATGTYGPVNIPQAYQLNAADARAYIDLAGDNFTVGITDSSEAMSSFTPAQYYGRTNANVSRRPTLSIRYSFKTGELYMGASTSIFMNNGRLIL